MLVAIEKISVLFNGIYLGYSKGLWRGAISPTHEIFLPCGVMDFALHVGPPLANLLTALWLFQKTTKPLTSSIHCQFIRRWK